MSLFAFDACVNFCLLSPSTGFFLFFVAQKGSPYFWCPQYVNYDFFNGTISNGYANF